VLPGLTVSDFGHFNTLVTSAAKPGRVAACGLPPHSWPQNVAPMFVVSDDGGRTWQQRALPLAGSVWECDLNGDLLDPDAYALGVRRISQGAVDGQGEMFITQDAGRTWQSGAPLASM